MMIKQELVSIIVPIYKAEKYIDECVRSLVNQTYGNIEIILVDDGSPDNSSLIIDLWAEKDKRIKVIHKKNEGVSKARNVGIDISVGKWILFVDADDIISETCVEELIKYSDRRVLSSGKIVRFSLNISEVKESENRSVIRGKKMGDLRGGLFACGALYERELINEISLRFDPEISNLEDSVFNCEYLCYISEVAYVDSPMYYYRITPSSAITKCVDVKYQISSWIKARRSMMNWFSDKSLRFSQKKYVRRIFRYCQNNLYAECFSGGVSYSEFKEIEKTYSSCDMRYIFAPERFLTKNFGKLYFNLYMTMFRIKKIISK